MKTVLLSSDDGYSIENYPYVAWAWNQLGWNTHLFFLGKDSKFLDVYKKTIKSYVQHLNPERNTIQRLPKIEGFENDVILSAAKLFGGFCFWENTRLMTADIDYIPLKDAWEDFDTTTEHIRFDTKISSYLSMPSNVWRKKMETSEKSNLEDELRLFLNSDPEFKDPEKVNRTICVNKNIIQKLFSKEQAVLNTASHFVADISDLPKSEIYKILNENFNKLPGWI